ncbi:MAG TPA: hypothetical protein VKB52_05260 [Rhodanobacteraceae bacterium]|nr:hypothetical protein [Rhodanobacteraceae bacterium]
MRSRQKTAASHGVRGRLSARRERWVYAVLSLLWASGAVWLVLRYFLRPAGEFGELPHPLEPWLMRLHGLGAFAALWLAGQLWIVHVVPSWRSHRRNSGILLGVIFAVLIVSGYLLYYAGDENLRAFVSIAHWSIGLVLVVPLLVHSLRRRSRRWGE